MALLFYTVGFVSIFSCWHCVWAWTRMRESSNLMIPRMRLFFFIEGGGGGGGRGGEGQLSLCLFINMKKQDKTNLGSVCLQVERVHHSQSGSLN